MSSGYKIGKRTYQFQIPLFLVSLFAGITIANHFIEVPAIQTLSGELLQWGVICGLMITVYAMLVLILSHTRRIMRTGVAFKLKFRSVILLISFVIFALLASLDPVKLTGGDTFQLVYTRTVSIIGTGAGPAMHLIFAWAAIKKLQRVHDIETLIMLITFTVTIIAAGMTVGAYVWRPIVDVGAWVKTVPNMIGQRAAIAAAGMGAIALTLRALMWKEPGIIEVEAVQDD